MERFSAKQLVEYLAKVAVDLDDEVLDVIRKAKVTGKRALKYDISAWSNIGLAYGDILEVMDCINNFSSFSQNTDKENSPPLSQASVEPMKSGPSTSYLTIHSQPTTTEPESNSENRRKRPHPITYSSDSDEEIVNLKKFECLKQYFSPEEFSDLSLSVKQSYLEEKDNYEFGLKQNVNIDRPSFMVPKKSSQKESKLMITPSTSTAQTIREHSQIKSLTAPTTSQSSLATNDKNSPKPSVSRKPASDKQARDSTLDSNETSDDESDDDSQNQNKSAKSSETSSVATSKKPRKKRQRLIDTLSNEEVANKLPKYDIEAILSGKGEKEKDVLEVLKSDGIVYEAQRKLMMRTLTKYIYFDEKGSLKKFVTTDEKSGMAASVVRAYPKFADNSDPKKRPWWRIFDPAGPSGYIANCIVGIQRAMNPSDRLRGGGQGKLVDVDENSDATASTSTSSDNYHDPEAEWMSLTMPYQASKPQLIQGMQKSFPVRRRWIVEQGPSITEVLTRYVHLVSFDSEMIEMEFNLITTDKASLFLQKFPSLVNAVLRLNGRDKIKVKMLEKGENKDTIEACLFLADKLPRPNLKRFSNASNDSVMPQQKTLVSCVPRGVNVQDFIQSRRDKTGVAVQPYLLAFVPEGQVSSLSIVVDSKTINLNTTSILKGLDMLFKVYFVFNVHYPLGWKMFWEMIQNGIYKIEPRKLTNSARELLLKYKVL